MENDKYKNIKEGFNELKKQGKKQVDEFKKKAIKAYDVVKDSIFFRDSFIEQTVEFEIVGSQNIINLPYKIRGFIIGKKEIFFKYDEKNINKIYQGTLLKTADNTTYEIKAMDKNKQVYQMFEINNEKVHVPCFRTKVKVFEK